MSVKKTRKQDNHFSVSVNKKLPKSDTRPGPGLASLDGKAVETGAGEMLGEDD